MALLNTGSDMSIINQKLINLNQITPRSQTLRFADNNSRRVSGIIKTNFSIDFKKFELAFLVMDNICVDIILGRDFIKKYGVSMILKNKTSLKQIEKNAHKCGVSECFNGFDKNKNSDLKLIIKNFNKCFSKLEMNLRRFNLN